MNNKGEEVISERQEKDYKKETVLDDFEEEKPKIDKSFTDI